jgi:hypothetical protein
VTDEFGCGQVISFDDFSLVRRGTTSFALWDVGLLGFAGVGSAGFAGVGSAGFDTVDEAELVVGRWTGVRVKPTQLIWCSSK